MPHSAMSHSDLGLHFFPITLLGVSRLQWVKTVIATDKAIIKRFLLSTFVLTLSMLGKTFRQHTEIFFSYSSQKTGFGAPCKLSLMKSSCMKCLILGKKYIINLSSAELAQRVVMDNSNTPRLYSQWLNSMIYSATNHWAEVCYAILHPFDIILTLC